MKPNDQVESNFNVNRDSASSLFAIVPTQLHEFVNFLICIQKINMPLESMLNSGDIYSIRHQPCSINTFLQSVR